MINKCRAMEGFFSEQVNEAFSGQFYHGFDVTISSKVKDKN